jgi:hypothetical protein
VAFENWQDDFGGAPQLREVNDVFALKIFLNEGEKCKACSVSLSRLLVAHSCADWIMSSIVRASCPEAGSNPSSNAMSQAFFTPAQ